MKTFSTNNTIFKYYDEGTVNIYDKEHDIEIVGLNTADLIKFVDHLRPKKETDNDRIKVGDIVKHFKYESLSEKEKSSNMYLYKILSFSVNTETEERMVNYMALYGNFQIYTRPYDMFISKVDTIKYPKIKQKYRFEVFDFID